VPRDFRVDTDLRPGRARISWAERVSGTSRPTFQLLRRRFDFPTAASDGAPVFDVDALFQPPALVTPWARIDRERCTAVNTRAEDGFVRGMVERFYTLDVNGYLQLVRLIVNMFDDVTETMQATELTGVFRVQEGFGPAAAPYTRARYWDIYEVAGDVYRGTIQFQEEPAPPGTPNEMLWVPAIGPPRSVRYAARRSESISSSGQTFTVTGSGGEPAGRLAIESQFVPEAGVTEWRFAIEDGDLEPGAFYYYRLFSASDGPNHPPVRGSALAGGDYGSHDLMYRLLPPVHQVQDVDPTKIDGGRPLFRFLEAFGHGVDHYRAQVDAIATRHEIATARADFLPHLARMIGWVPDFTVPEHTQRQDIRFAPEVFGGLGTRPSAPALVNRVTGWPSRVKEFARNVLLTNAPEFIPIWEIWQVTRNGPNAWSAPAPLSITTSMDGAPTALRDNGTVWIVWHSDRGGQRELWFQRIGVDTEPQRVMGPPAPGADVPTWVDESPALALDGTDVRLFWASDRGGSRDIYTTVLTPTAGPIQKLTDHPKEDARPAAVHDGTDLWVFWDSDRRGVRDIWYRRRAGAVWSEPARMPKPPELDLAHDSSPAAVAIGGDIWLFWCRDKGDRREIWRLVVVGGDLSNTGAQQSMSEDLRGGVRDEAPAAVPLATTTGTQVWLLFHSNRGGPWQIWTHVYDGTWSTGAQRLSPEVTAETEPAGYEDGAGQLCVLWTSQRRTRWYQSRTLDLNDLHVIAEIGTFNDHGHYVYDTGDKADDWYARGTVGVYLEPASPASDVTVAARRADDFLAPFRPACVRYVWPLGDLAHEEAIDVGSFVGETWSDS
jgi:hypothetical protein